MAKTKQGYVLSWIDSNRPRFESEMIYQTGERSLFYELNDTRIEVAPYRDHEEELDTTLQAIEQWCGHPLLTNSS